MALGPRAFAKGSVERERRRIAETLDRANEYKRRGMPLDKPLPGGIKTLGEIIETFTADLRAAEASAAWLESLPD